MALEEYRRKRSFDATPEPEGAKGKAAGARWRFVVHEHHASRLHFDFRLEIDGVLKSWAVPKGPSLDPAARHLAVQVEDHPVDYIGFRGRIPAGNYGAGEVAIWDSGTFAPDPPSADPAAALGSGKFSFIMSGKKLKGGFSLIRMRDGKNWLLLKAKDAHAESGWTLETELGEGVGRAVGRAREAVAAKRAAPRAAGRAKGVSRQGGKPKARTRPAPGDGDGKARRGRAKVADKLPRPPCPGAVPAPMPADLEPMKAVLADRPFDREGWLFETKWDGVRAFAYIDGGQLRLVSRNHKEIAFRYPELAGLPGRVAGRRAILDGEIVALDEAGRPSFQALQARVGLQDRDGIARIAGEAPATFAAFDLLYLDGYSLLDAPLSERKRLLRGILREGPGIHYSDHMETDGEGAFGRARAGGQEGVVAKRMAAPYVQGRSEDWLKIKVQARQEAVIGGYTEPRGTRPLFGALLVGLYREGRLEYAGHVGGGFDREGLEKVFAAMRPLRTKACPFAEPPRANEAAHWVRPELVCEVKFAQWTRDGRMRQPIFLGLRDDKDPRQCVREIGASPERAAEAAESEPPPARPVRRKPRAGAGASEAGGMDYAALASLWPGDAPPAGGATVEADGHRVALTHLEKLYWPGEGLSKGHLLGYYARLAPAILPYLADRPLILKRFPRGIGGPHFFQHDIPAPPPFLGTARLESEEGRELDYALCGNAAALLYLANLGAIPLHPWHSRVANLDAPDWVVFDLDPGPDAGFGAAVEGALRVRDLLGRLGLRGYAKTSGGRGVHVYVPLAPGHEYAQAADFAARAAARLEAGDPGLFTLERSLERRDPAKVYLDHLQNARGKSVVAPYSVREKPGAPVSAPLDWKELKSGLDPADFHIGSMAARWRRKGDLFAPALAGGQALAPALAALAALEGPARGVAPRGRNRKAT